MNKEVIKAMNKTETKSATKTIGKWWDKNGYKVLRVVFFPVWGIEVARTKYNAWANTKQEWNEERAQEILNYYIPRVAEWDNEAKTFYFFDNGMGWSMKRRRKTIKAKDRRFWKVNAGWGGYKMRTYLIDNFELEGFTKEVGNCWEGWTEITFILNIEKA